MTTWVFVFGVITLAAGASSYVLRARQDRGGVLGELASLVCAVAGIAACSAALRATWPTTFDGTEATLNLLMPIAMIAGGAATFWQRQRAGAVLIDLGRAPDNGFPLLIGAISLIIATVRAINVVETGQWNQPSRWGEAPAFFILGFFSLAVGLRRIQIREGGVCGLWGVIPWPDVAKYEVGPDEVIRVWSKRTIFRMRLRVPQDRLDEVTRVLDLRSGTVRRPVETSQGTLGTDAR